MYAFWGPPCACWGSVRPPCCCHNQRHRAGGSGRQGPDPAGPKSRGPQGRAAPGGWREASCRAASSLRCPQTLLGLWQQHSAPDRCLRRAAFPVRPSVCPSASCECYRVSTNGTHTDPFPSEVIHAGTQGPARTHLLVGGQHSTLFPAVWPPATCLTSLCFYFRVCEVTRA